MAKKVKKPISKPKKKGGLKKKKSGNIFTKILVVIFIVIFVAFFALRFIGNQKSTTTDGNRKIEKKEVIKRDKVSDKETKKTTKIVEKTITGSWMSSSEGAILIMKDHSYRIDYMGVDIDQPFIGMYSVVGDNITFENKKDPCKDAKGLYEVSYKDKEISFKCKSDECSRRKTTLTTEWEWIDIDE